MMWSQRLTGYYLKRGKCILGSGEWVGVVDGLGVFVCGLGFGIGWAWIRFLVLGLDIKKKGTVWFCRIIKPGDQACHF